MSIFRGRTRKEIYLSSLLYDSIEDRDFSATKILLTEKGADPNGIVPNKGISPFHLAIGDDSNEFAIKMTEILLQHGGDPNVRSDDGLTPVHIAAAYGRKEILQLLLSNGGDPEIKDINHQTAFHYAHQQNYADCFKLMLHFLPNKSQLLNGDDEDCEKFNFTLDKIIVNNGVEVGEYAIVKQEEEPVKNYTQLPNTTEYVMNWFDKHHKNGVNFSQKLDKTGSSDSLETMESSPDESDFDLRKPLNTDNITFRKAYTKTRKISGSDSSKKTVRTTSPSKSTKEESEDKSMYTALGFSTIDQFSKESGILTLPDSSKENSVFQDKSIEESMSIKIDASSDYLTCSTTSDNDLEKNIFEITEDLTTNTEDNKSINSNKSVEKIQMVPSASPDLTFVSVSEVYKYVDEDQGVVLYERRLLKTPNPSEYCGSLPSSSFSSKVSSLPETIDYDTDALRKELTTLGYNPGPITVTTKRVYLKKLRQLKRKPQLVAMVMPEKKKAFSVELEKTLRHANWLDNLTAYKNLEEIVSKQFSSPDPSRKWREGINKTSFTYLLLDPRVTNNLPCRAEMLQPKEIWETFLSAIFYVGKGKRARPYSHLYDAVALWNKKEYKTSNKKLQQIIDIWKNDSGVICLHVFQNIIPVEAYTREASMLAALKLDNVSNIKSGEFYGLAATWPNKDRRMLGVYLLYKAMMIFLNEGERQLCPNDIDTK